MVSEAYFLCYGDDMTSSTRHCVLSSNSHRHLVSTLHLVKQRKLCEIGLTIDRKLVLGTTGIQLPQRPTASLKELYALQRRLLRLPSLPKGRDCWLLVHLLLGFYENGTYLAVFLLHSGFWLSFFFCIIIISNKQNDWTNVYRGSLQLDLFLLIVCDSKAMLM